MRFSVVIPTFNTAEPLRECLACLSAQTFPDWEAIVVNDGSSDHTEEVLAAATAGDSRIRSLTQPNAGVATARNAGIAQATGEWVALLDGDDYYLPWALEVLDTLITTHPQADICCGEAPTDPPTSRPPTPHPSAEMDAFYAIMAFEGDAPPLTMQSTAIRRRILGEIGGFDPRFFEDDSHFWVRATAHHRVAYTRAPIAVWRVGHADTRTDRFTSSTRAILDAQRMFAALATDDHIAARLAVRGESERFARLLEMRLRTLDAALALREGRMSEAGHALCDAWMLGRSGGERDLSLQVLCYHLYYPRTDHAVAAPRCAGWLRQLTQGPPIRGTDLAAGLRRRAAAVLLLAGRRLAEQGQRRGARRLVVLAMRQDLSAGTLRSCAYVLRR